MGNQLLYAIVVFWLHTTQGEVMNMIIHDRIDTNLNYHYGEVLGAY